jgi:hypothetical protein
MVQEVFGDATRGGDWAAVRLVVDGENIVGRMRRGSVDRSSV